MKTAVKSPESADCRGGLGIFLTETPPTGTPKHFFRPLSPATPISLPSSPPHWLFHVPAAESKLPAAKLARILWAMVKHRRPYDPSRLGNPELARLRKERYLRRQASNLVSS